LLIYQEVHKLPSKYTICFRKYKFSLDQEIYVSTTRGNILVAILLKIFTPKIIINWKVWENQVEWKGTVQGLNNSCEKLGLISTKRWILAKKEKRDHWRCSLVKIKNPQKVLLEAIEDRRNIAKFMIEFKIRKWMIWWSL
jgi:hypothetical protein